MINAISPKLLSNQENCAQVNQAVHFIFMLRTYICCYTCLLQSTWWYSIAWNRVRKSTSNHIYLNCNFADNTTLSRYSCTVLLQLEDSNCQILCKVLWCLSFRNNITDKNMPDQHVTANERTSVETRGISISSKTVHLLILESFIKNREWNEKV